MDRLCSTHERSVVEKSEGRRLVGGPRPRWEYNIKINLK
jgi:hypothetical protein